MHVEVTELLGKVLQEIDISEDKDEILFTSNDGTRYKMYHDQECCEGVYVEDICGDLANIIGSPLLMAEEATSNENPEGCNLEDQDSFTWTFYKFATAKGYVTIRWYGESNGYYSESVSFKKLDYQGEV